MWRAWWTPMATSPWCRRARRCEGLRHLRPRRRCCSGSREGGLAASTGCAGRRSGNAAPPTRPPPSRPATLKLSTHPPTHPFLTPLHCTASPNSTVRSTCIQQRMLPAPPHLMPAPLPAPFPSSERCVLRRNARNPSPYAHPPLCLPSDVSFFPCPVFRVGPPTHQRTSTTHGCPARSCFSSRAARCLPAAFLGPPQLALPLLVPRP